MTRSPEFDRSKAVDGALRLFWRKGYQASSLTDLLSAMGIGRSSFYATFTDKRGLFIECLDLFAQRTLDLLERAHDGLSPVDALQAFFERDFVGARGARGQWGCMLVSTVLEMAGVDDDLAARASRHLDRVQQLFRTFLQDAGAPPPLAGDLAALLMLVNEGVRVSSRREPPDLGRLQPIATIFRLVRSAIANPIVPELTREITV